MGSFEGLFFYFIHFIQIHFNEENAFGIDVVDGLCLLF